MSQIRSIAKLGGIATALLIVCRAALATGQEQYPKPLVHTRTDHPADRLLLLSIDGLHAIDLATWTATHPRSALASLGHHGVTYTDAHTPVAEPAAGLVSIATGGTPISTGIISDDGYDRTLSPPGSSCRTRGAPLLLDPARADPDSVLPIVVALDPAQNCRSISPHELVLVNTIFEVVRQEYGRTAWAGESAVVTDLLRGPSGAGLSEACVVAPMRRGDWRSAVAADDRGVISVLRWIGGRTCDGAHNASIPALFGMSFTGFAATQQTAGMGYLDAAGSPSEALTAELGRIDASISRIMDALREKDLLNSTWIIVVSPCAEAPMRPQQRREIPLSAVQAAVEGTRSGLIAHISGGGVARIWLVDPSKTKIVVRVLNTAAESLGIRDIDAGRRLSLTLNSPQSDPRRPDIVLHGEAGVIWTRGSRHPAMIGGGDDDESTHVALLVSGPQFMDRSDPTWVPNTQIAPLLLRALGLEKFDLQALHREHTPALPGIF